MPAHVKEKPMNWMYRLQQRLAITRRESIAILTLSGLLLLGLVASESRAPHAPIDPATYAKVDARFKARTAALPGANRPAAAHVATPTDSSSTEATDTTRLNLNTASAAALQRLPGIGPALSSRIQNYRQVHGDFAQVEDITRVRGIGPKTLKRLQSMLYVESAPQ